MNVFQAAVLGLVQGLGEFLPISSSGHLVVFPWLFNWEDPGLAFDVALHAGTLIAVVAFFWKDLINIITLGLGKKSKSSDQELGYNKKTLWLLAAATIPGVIAGVLLEKKAETVFRNPLLVAATLSLVGLILYLVDRYAKHRKNLNETSWKDSVLIGLSQAVAIIPGVSRSGATITTGLALGLNRVSAARFSFLLSTPIILGATVLKLPHLLSEGLNASLIVGILVSAISGYAAIKYLIKFIEKTSYAIFFWYRLLLALVIAVVYFIK